MPQTLKICRQLVAALIVGTVTVGVLTGCANPGLNNAGVAVAAAPAAQTTAVNTTHPLYELRTYTTNDGKLEALHSRFRDHTQRLFEKHGMVNVAYWTPTDKPNTLIYIIAHKSPEAAKVSWAAFVADPEWQAAYAASIADGRLVNNIDSVYMQKTDYSPAN